MSLKIGDIVARKSYNKDIFFKIESITETDSGEQLARLRGLDVRLYADSPVNDLIKVTSERIREYRNRFIKRNNESLKKIMARRAGKHINHLARSENDNLSDFFDVPGRVLHIDGNLEYLNLCMAIYKQLGIIAKGVHVPEKEQPASVPDLLKKYRPDILVLTGHDGIIKSSESFTTLENYHNSRHFVDAVKSAREFEADKDQLIIFAGACQSHYEDILSAGANYASSPLRVLIHAFDPVFIVEKIAFTPIDQTISINEAIDSTITGIEGLGGIETRGKYRRGFPKSPY